MCLHSGEQLLQQGLIACTTHNSLDDASIIIAGMLSFHKVVIGKPSFDNCFWPAVQDLPIR